MPKRLPIEELQVHIPAGKENRPETGEHAVDVLYNLALLKQRGELQKLPKIPILNKVFEQAIADLNRNRIESSHPWSLLFASGEVLLPENDAKAKLLDRMRKHVSATPETAVA